MHIYIVVVVERERERESVCGMVCWLSALPLVATSLVLRLPACAVAVSNGQIHCARVISMLRVVWPVRVLLPKESMDF